MVRFMFATSIANSRPQPIPDSRKNQEAAAKTGSSCCRCSLPWRPLWGLSDAARRRTAPSRPATCQSGCATCSVPSCVRLGLANLASSAVAPGAENIELPPPRPLVAATFDVTPREDAGHVVQDVGGRVFIVPVVANEPGLDDVDLFLRVLVDDARNQAG